MKILVLALSTSTVFASAPWGGRVAIDVTRTKIESIEDVGITGTVNYKGLEGVSLGGSYKIKGGTKLIPEKIKIDSSFEVGGGFMPEFNVDSVIGLDASGAGVALDFVAKKKGSKTSLLASFDSKSLALPKSVELRRAFSLGPSAVIRVAPKLSPRKGLGATSYKVDLESGKSTLTLAGGVCDKKGAAVTAVHRLDPSNTLTLLQKPFAERKAAPVFTWARNLTKGSITATLTPGKKVGAVWSDPAFAGAWVTTASVPFEKNEPSTLAFKRTFLF